MVEGSGIEIADIEAFMDGIKHSLDTLDNFSQDEVKGFQAQLAKTILELRIKRTNKIKAPPEHIGHYTKQDLKNHLLSELEFLQDHIDSMDYNHSKKFKLVMKIAKLRERVNSM